MTRNKRWPTKLRPVFYRTTTKTEWDWGLHRNAHRAVTDFAGTSSRLLLLMETLEMPAKNREKLRKHSLDIQIRECCAWLARRFTSTDECRTWLRLLWATHDLQDNLPPK